MRGVGEAMSEEVAAEEEEEEEEEESAACIEAYVSREGSDSSTSIEG